ncbi:MAG: endonuclease III [Candidatus Campbellbacteria bacterium]|nr:endonuclease III [Candidatus Campbellbacteria bacterium]
MNKNSEDLKRRKEISRIVIAELSRLYPEKLETPLNYSKNHELLFAVILSAQTTDKKVNQVTEKLFKKYNTLNKFAEVSEEDLRKDILEIGFSRAKAKYIRDSARIIKSKFKARIPKSMEELTSLPGVGRKTANVVRGHLFGEVDGIAVDTHVLRLARKFGLVNTNDPEIVEKELMDLWPKNEWFDISYKLKAYGREISPARGKSTDPISAILAKKGLI